jgi:hypothetical protein
MAGKDPSQIQKLPVDLHLAIMQQHLSPEAIGHQPVKEQQQHVINVNYPSKDVW